MKNTIILPIVALFAFTALAQAAEPPPPETKVAADNLTVIDGIGPKVNKALTVAGITTYDRLANASEAEMRAAIASAGMVPPKSLDTWPRQAKYAEAGEWQELYKFNAKRKLAARA